MNGSHLRHAPVTVAIVSRNHLVRIGLQAALAGQDRIRLSGEAAGRLEMDALIAREQPHALVIEMEPDLDIAELVRSVKQSAPETRIILLSPMGEMTSRMGSATSGIDGIVLTIQPGGGLAGHHQPRLLPPGRDDRLRMRRGKPLGKRALAPRRPALALPVVDSAR